MRALIISAVLLAVVLIFVFSSSAWLSGFFSKLFEMTGSDGPDSAVRISNAWKKGKITVLLFFDKEETDDIDKSLDKMISAADEKEYTAALNELRYEIKRMKDMLDIRLENIF